MTELYPLFKHLHMTCVGLSVLLFTARGLGMLVDAQWIRNKLMRVLPHIIDTVLLLSAIALVIILQAYPFQTDWVSAKIIGLIVYIALGVIALKKGKTKKVRATAFILGLITVGYIASVAVTHNPMPW
ncbi:SirB2 family protein [Neptunomonas phycophila]|uniref:SirB2 family protein n=1 Tax=Neptunomonas phycophila TaxID=1572645 RepID=A0AAW7XHA8_9GAMM|nr:SirB2 family protein [Neptunomonas phycophila]MDO6452982.1 SirB2 family protein [Neptunomonas phycophila]